MPLFRIHSDQQAQRLHAERFQLERQLQKIVEKNLEEIFGVRFIASEFVVYGEQPGRIDTLGLDFDGTPTIIEYKRDKNDSVINQGLFYMHWIMSHRGDFVLAAREKLGAAIEINWSHPRVIIVAQNYNKWDKEGVKLMGGNIELWEYTLYDGKLLYLNPIYGQSNIPQKPRDVSATIPTEASPVEPVAAYDTLTETAQSDAVPEYTIESHKTGKPAAIQQLFDDLREIILELQTNEGEIVETANKMYIGYRHGKNFCEVQIQLKAINIWLSIPIAQLDDPQKIARDVSTIGRHGTGETQVKLTKFEDLPYIFSLIEQAYRLTL